MSSRIFRSILLVAAAVLLMSFVIIMDVLYGFFTENQNRQLEAELALAAYGTEQGGADWLEGVRTDGYRLTRIAPDGVVLYDSKADPAAMENHLSREEVRSALESGGGESVRVSKTLTEKTFYRATLLSDGTVLRISITQNSLMTLVLGMLTPVLIVFAAAVALSAILARRLARRIVRPLNVLDLEHPLDNDAYEELSPLLTRIAQQRREISRQMDILKRRQDEFAVITKNMGEGLVLLNEQGVVVSMNPAARALFHADDDCEGRDFLTVERGRDIRLAIEKALLSGHGEAAIERDGRRYEIDVSRILSDGRTAGAALLSFDTTDRSMAEKRRREFTANVSHELKTPLQAIMGGAELLEQGLVKAEDVPEFARRIRSEAARLVALIEDIIRLSQLDEGGELPMEQVELLPVVREAAKAVEAAAAARGVEICVGGGSAKVRGVRRLLFEIAYNLMDNAVKYNAGGGSVTAAVSEDGESVYLSVKDTGIGIPKEHLDRIFERFYRVDKSHSRETGGTGLGLSIVKHAVEAHGGEISVRSEVGKGTEIRVRFPKQRI